jgi:plasmid stabilization system protein ParE
MVIFSPESESDLERIYLSIAYAGFPSNAAGFTKRIVEFCTSMTTFPKRGQSHDDISRGLRSVGYDKQVNIIFRVSESPREVLIVRILNKGESLERALTRL